MKLLTIIFLMGVFVIFSQNIQAASFDCSKATTLVETTICQNPELSRLDEQLSEEYKKALKKADAPQVKQEQQLWLKQRNECKTEVCLKTLYQNRINEISKNEKSPLLSASNLSGTYKEKYGSLLKVRQKGDQVEFYLEAIWAHNGRANTGIMCGDLILKNKEGISKSISDDPDPKSCEIKFIVRGAQIELEQLGDSSGCGFGFNVSANGVYVKKSSKVPDLKECGVEQ